MSDITCAACGATDLQPATACRACLASPQWQDFFQASHVASEQFAELYARQLLSEPAFARAQDLLTSQRLQWRQQIEQNLEPPAESGLPSPARCRKCNRPSDAAQNFCAVCGDATGAPADQLRYLDFTTSFFIRHLSAGMSRDDSTRCLIALAARSKAVETELKHQAARPQPTAVVKPPALPRQNLIEILLDPQSIRWLLTSGGALLAVGLVIFLASLGVFKNALAVASTMGVGTLGLLAGGIAMIRLTRHSLAGRAMALLGCLVMPLNLWFYNANQLVTLDGHLWLAAMVCCVLYAAAAFVLEDPLFVYVLFGGITMTGMLALGDMHRLAEISAPSALLIGLGLISLHAERAFADNDGPFSRKRFGLACFGSAQAMIGLGLLLLLGSHITGWMPNVGFGFGTFAALPRNQYLSLALVLAGAYAYAYSSIVVRQKSIYAYIAVGCVLWAELLGLQISHLANHLPVLMAAMALTSLAMSFAASLLGRDVESETSSHATSLALLDGGLGMAALVVAVLPFVDGMLFFLPDSLDLNVGWSYVGAVALTAIASRIAAALQARDRGQLSATHHVITSVATFIAAATALNVIGVAEWQFKTLILMAIPMLYLLAARLHRDGPAKQILPTLAGIAAIGLTACSLISGGLQWINPAAHQPADLWLAGFSLEAALFFAIAGALRGGKHNIYFATAMVCGMLYQLLGYFGLPLQSYNVALASLGVMGLIAHRVLGMKSNALLISANGLISLPMAGVMLLNLSRLALGHVDGSMLAVPALLCGLSLLASLISGSGTRRWYAALTISQFLLSMVVLAQYSTLSLPRKMEGVSVITGLVLLSVGYGLWYRTQDDKSDGASFCLLFGALMAGLPPAGFAIVNRFGFDVSFVDELALVTIAVLMFLTGMMSRMRVTTLIGGGLLACHLITLIIFAGMKAQLALGAYVAIGGAALFVVGLLLSVFRERLLELPQRIKYRQGMFRVLAWN